MTGESEFLSLLRALPLSPAARGFADDAAVLEIGGARLVLTHDMIVEGVHFLPDDPPADVAWKLVAVNLSDLAAKGAIPVGVLLGYSLAAEDDWNRRFLQGLEEALSRFAVPLLGGDTVSAPSGTRRALGLTAIGEASGPVPSRSGASPGDLLWVSGSIGGAGAGLRVALGQADADPLLLRRYRRPEPRLDAGRALAPLVCAMMDVSDGLFIDASRMAEASGVGLAIDLDQVPVEPGALAEDGDDLRLRIDCSIAGDDYELLFAAPEDRSAAIRSVSDAVGLPLTPIGRFGAQAGLEILHHGAPVPLPHRLGYEHGA